MVVNAYVPLRMIQPVNDFKVVFKGAVQGHRWAWNVLGILHRDVSVENVMFYNTGSEVVGILDDCDYASEKDDLRIREFDLPDVVMLEENDLEGDSASGHQHPGLHDSSVEALDLPAVKQTNYRTGTGPFMAIELLVDHLIPCHRYRYGLESFFYVMIWFCTGFNPRKHHVKPIDAWQAQAFRTNGTTKGQFFQYDAERKLIWARAEDTGCLELCMAWSDPIITMLRDVFQATILINLAIDGCLLVQSEDLNREIEAEREYVASLARTREEALTYEKFMDALSSFSVFILVLCTPHRPRPRYTIRLHVRPVPNDKRQGLYTTSYDTKTRAESVSAGSPWEAPDSSAIKPAEYRTGTGPFMALELLMYNPVPRHHYRYDLEPFFYVLQYTSIGSAKKLFLEQLDKRERIWSIARSAKYVDLCKTWSKQIIVQLRALNKFNFLLNDIIQTCLQASEETLETVTTEQGDEAALYARKREEAYVLLVTHINPMNDFVTQYGPGGAICWVSHNVLDLSC
ncbi:hypothetical protein CERSUDRAFT_72539 [Gelatoporia subvermispora B]|uniref:Fungal-type protein kinase domain-containing protein n=1 Tax=Ceriporiopsis subvermispora (strain B) TaxID=914234 RepID=M2PRY1_CERS8|nr:hypothetical protein CERSUDRAFT_72539 [Gelatoporia subvermispora B]